MALCVAVVSKEVSVFICFYNIIVISMFKCWYTEKKTGFKIVFITS